MRARDLADPSYPQVTLSSDALAAARLVVDRGLPGLLVLDDGHVPYAVLPTTLLVRALVPEYIRDDPRLAAAIDEPHADAVGARLARVAVRSCLSGGHQPPPVVRPDDTLLEVAALIARTASPLVVVAAGERVTDHLLGVITASRLLERLLRGAP